MAKCANRGGREGDGRGLLGLRELVAAAVVLALLLELLLDERALHDGLRVRRQLAGGRDARWNA